MTALLHVQPSLLPAPGAREAAIDRLHRATALYTREPIVRELLACITRWPGPGRHLVDSSCGDGAFIGAALQLLLSREPAICDRDIVARISGWEIHPEAAGQARERVAELLVIVGGRGMQRAAALGREIVHCADFLTEGPVARADVSVGNPPYARMPSVPSPLREEYLDLVPSHARADLLHSFLDRCAQMLAPDGELALVTSDRWLFALGAAQLREVIGSRFGIERVRRLDVTSAFYRPKQRRVGTPPRVHPVAVFLKAATDAQIALGRAPIYPGDDYAHYAHNVGGSPVLGDVAEVRIAPWLGTAGVFLIGAEAASRLPADSLVPAVDTDDVVNGMLRAPTRFAIRTHPDVEPPRAVREHLAREMPRMCARGRERRSPWMPPESFHRFALGEPSLLVPRIAKTLAPIHVPPGVLPVNHNLSICSGRIDGPRRDRRRAARRRVAAMGGAPCSAAGERLPLADHQVAS